MKRSLTHYIIFMIILQIILYIVVYGSPFKVIKLLYESEIVYYARAGIIIPVSCRKFIAQLIFPDPLIYSYIASFFVARYLDKAGINPLPSKKYFLIYILVIIDEYYTSIQVMGPFRGKFPFSLLLHTIWMMDDFVIFLLLFRVLELALNVLFNTKEIINKNIKIVSVTLWSWLALLFGWLLPWILYGSLFYYAIAPVCLGAKARWINSLESMARFGLPIVIFISSIFTGMLYAVYKLVKSTYKSYGLSGKDALVSTAIPSFIFVSALKILLYKIIFIIKEGIFDVAIYFASFTLRPTDITDIFLFYINLISYWTTSFFIGYEIYINKHGVIKMAE